MSYADEILADSPEAFWLFDETTGTNLVDSSGNGRDATLAGGALDQQGPGTLRAIDFAGTQTEHAVVTGWKSVDTSLPFSYELWAKADSTAQVSHLMAQDRAGTFWAPEFSLSTQVANEYAGGSRQFGGSGSTVVYTGVAADLDWHHLVLTYENTPSLVYRLYLDGFEIDTEALPGVPLNDTGADLHIARRNHGTDGRPFAGLIAAPAIYDHALSPSRVEAHHDAAFAVSLYESVDDDPASPDDADWVNNAVEVS